MSDFRDPNDPLWRGTSYEPATPVSNARWGWIAGALVLVVLVAIAFGIGHGPTQTASNDSAPPSAAAPHAVSPALPGLLPPPAPAPQTPQRGTNQ